MPVDYTDYCQAHGRLYDFIKKNENDKVFWLHNGVNVRGELIISFDKKKCYNLFADYPHNLTDEEIEIFDKENPFWADFFKHRKEKLKK